MSRAWTFQDGRQKKKLGEKKCPWSVGYIDPDGARRSKKIGSKSMAEKFRRKIEGQLAAGTYEGTNRKQWSDFTEDYDNTILSGLAGGSRESALIALKHFKRIIKPRRVDTIKTATVDEFIAKRRTERGAKKGSTVSPATVNKELRSIKAALRIAHEWKYLPEVPRVRMLKEPEKLVTYVTPEHFAAIYQACDAATRPKGNHYTPGDWWRALVTFAYMTGWRISEPLALRWDDVSLDTGRAVTRHRGNKGKRDDAAPLHPVVVDHLRKITDFGPLVFYWPHHRRTLWEDFTRIQEAAGIHLPCPEDHEHNRYCHVYGFHDLRRAFATLNAETMSADALQALMRHKSYTTTQRYINLANQVNRAVEGLHVPEVLKRDVG